jgi:tripartite-type tricarboxylate transporter receptor subunit TctC
MGIMTLPRRTFLHLAAGAAALPAVPRVTWAQTYPVRPVRMIVGFAAGQAIDILARLVGQWLSGDSLSNSSSKTDRAPVAISAPKSSRVRPQMDIRCS